jgi:hypothetical protein
MSTLSHDLKLLFWVVYPNTAIPIIAKSQESFCTMTLFL